MKIDSDGSIHLSNDSAKQSQMPKQIKPTVPDESQAQVQQQKEDYMPPNPFIQEERGNDEHFFDQLIDAGHIRQGIDRITDAKLAVMEHASNQNTSAMLRYGLVRKSALQAAHGDPQQKAKELQRQRTSQVSKGRMSNQQQSNGRKATPTKSSCKHNDDLRDLLVITDTKKQLKQQLAKQQMQQNQTVTSHVGGGVQISGVPSVSISKNSSFDVTDPQYLISAAQPAGLANIMRGQGVTGKSITSSVTGKAVQRNLEISLKIDTSRNSGQQNASNNQFDKDGTATILQQSNVNSPALRTQSDVARHGLQPDGKGDLSTRALEEALFSTLRLHSNDFSSLHQDALATQQQDEGIEWEQVKGKTLQIQTDRQGESRLLTQNSVNEEKHQQAVALNRTRQQTQERKMKDRSVALRQQTRDMHVSPMSFASTLSPLSPSAAAPASPSSPRRQVFSRNSNNMIMQPLKHHTMANQTFGSVNTNNSGAGHDSGNKLKAVDEHTSRENSQRNTTNKSNPVSMQMCEREAAAILDLDPQIEMFRKQGQDSFLMQDSLQNSVAGGVGNWQKRSHRDLAESSVETIIEDSIQQTSWNCQGSVQTKTNYVSLQCQPERSVKHDQKQLKPKKIPRLQLVSQQMPRKRIAGTAANTSRTNRSSQQQQQQHQKNSVYHQIDTERGSVQEPVSGQGVLSHLLKLRAVQGGYLLSPRGAISPKIEQRALEIMHTMEATNTALQRNQQVSSSIDSSHQLPRVSMSQPGCERPKLADPKTMLISPRNMMTAISNTSKNQSNELHTRTRNGIYLNRRARYSNLTLDQANDLKSRHHKRLLNLDKQETMLSCNSNEPPTSQKELHSQSHAINQKLNPQLPPVAFDGLLKAPPNASINRFARKKKFQVCKGTFLTQTTRRQVNAFEQEQELDSNDQVSQFKEQLWQNKLIASRGGKRFSQTHSMQPRSPRDQAIIESQPQQRLVKKSLNTFGARLSQRAGSQQTKNEVSESYSGEAQISVRGVVKPRRTMLQSLQQPIDAQIFKNIFQFNVIEQKIKQSQAQEEIKVFSVMHPNAKYVANIVPSQSHRTVIQTPIKTPGDCLLSTDKIVKGMSTPYSPIPEELADANNQPHTPGSPFMGSMFSSGCQLKPVMNINRSVVAHADVITTANLTPFTITQSCNEQPVEMVLLSPQLQNQDMAGIDDQAMKVQCIDHRQHQHQRDSERMRNQFRSIKRKSTNGAAASSCDEDYDDQSDSAYGTGIINRKFQKACEEENNQETIPTERSNIDYLKQQNDNLNHKQDANRKQEIGDGKEKSRNTTRGVVTQLSISVRKSARDLKAIQESQKNNAGHATKKAEPESRKISDDVSIFTGKPHLYHAESRETSISPTFSPQLKNADKKSDLKQKCQSSGLKDKLAQKSISPASRKSLAQLSFAKNRYEPCFSKIMDFNRLTRPTVADRQAAAIAIKVIKSQKHKKVAKADQATLQRQTMSQGAGPSSMTEIGSTINVQQQKLNSGAKASEINTDLDEIKQMQRLGSQREPPTTAPGMSREQKMKLAGDNQQITAPDGDSRLDENRVSELAKTSAKDDRQKHEVLDSIISKGTILEHSSALSVTSEYKKIQQNNDEVAIQENERRDSQVVLTGEAP